VNEITHHQRPLSRERSSRNNALIKRMKLENKVISLDSESGNYSIPKQDM
jgi:hypothetical protein